MENKREKLKELLDTVIDTMGQSIDANVKADEAKATFSKHREAVIAWYKANPADPKKSSHYEQKEKFYLEGKEIELTVSVQRGDVSFYESGSEVDNLDDADFNEAPTEKRQIILDALASYNEMCHAQVDANNKKQSFANARHSVKDYGCIHTKYKGYIFRVYIAGYYGERELVIQDAGIIQKL